MVYEKPDVAIFLTTTTTATLVRICEYRCTRPDRYGKNTPGHTDVSARQGYYIDAECEADAHKRMREEFPTDTHFDVQLWRDASGKLVV